MYFSPLNRSGWGQISRLEDQTKGLLALLGAVHCLGDVIPAAPLWLFPWLLGHGLDQGLHGLVLILRDRIAHPVRQLVDPLRRVGGRIGPKITDSLPLGHALLTLPIEGHMPRARALVALPKLFKTELGLKEKAQHRPLHFLIGEARLPLLCLNLRRIYLQGVLPDPIAPQNARMDLIAHPPQTQKPPLPILRISMHLSQSPTRSASGTCSRPISFIRARSPFNFLRSSRLRPPACSIKTKDHHRILSATPGKWRPTLSPGPWLYCARSAKPPCAVSSSSVLSIFNPSTVCRFILISPPALKGLTSQVRIHSPETSMTRGLSYIFSPSISVLGKISR